MKFPAFQTYSEAFFCAGAVLMLLAPQNGVSDPLSRDPLCFYRFDETSGPALDSSSNKLDGVYGSNVSHGGKSAQFPGGLASSKNAIIVPAHPLLQPSASVSIEAWIKLSSLNSSGKSIDFVSYGSENAGQAYTLQISPSDKIEFYLNTRSGNAGDLVGSTVLKANQAYHVIATYDGSVQKIYLNGNLDSQAPVKSGGALDYSRISGLGLSIGACQDCSRQAFSGSIGNVAIYDHALSVGNGTGSLQNGVEWPANFRPYGSNSIWNMPLPDSPQRIYANSQAIINLAYSDGAVDGPMLRTQESGPNDLWHPLFFASSTDPWVNTQCTTLSCNDNIPTQIYIPARARPAGGSDHHMGVIQPDGTEVDFWQVSSSGSRPNKNWKSGDTLSYQGGSSCGNFYNGPGSGLAAATAGGACLGGGVARAAEMQAGAINHALFLVAKCEDPSVYVYPAHQLSQPCQGPGPHIPLGAHIQLDLTVSQIDALNLQSWEKTLLRAMHTYGGYVMDSSATNSSHATGVGNMMFESPESFTAYGNPDPMVSLAQSWGWISVPIPNFGIRYIGAGPWMPLNWAQHLRIVDPCYAQGTCAQ